MNHPLPAPTPTQLTNILNYTVSQELDGIATTEWDENHISFLMVRAVRLALEETSTFQPRYSDYQDNTFHIQAQAYKVSGDFERTHGDIVMAITHVMDGRPLTGLGFYEAKAAGLDGNYPAFKMRQLRRLTSSTPRLSLLLYERSKMWVSDDDFPLMHQDTYSGVGGSRVRVLGGNLASRFSNLHSDFVSLYAQSFGHHFVARYLSGRDLDYSREPVESLQRWLQVTRRALPLLVAVTLSNHDAVAPTPILPEYSPLPKPMPRLDAETDRQPLP
jgi:hypothetical protein